jgi:hypothetical protein
MKQNLETLKKILDENAVWLEMPMTRKVIQWESEFEKELREAYQHPEKLTGKGLLISKNKASQKDLQYGEGWRQGTFRAIREVLGVEPKVKEEK